ncbi:hypothetical protein N8564_04390 [Verrucomicrobiales bacterium]|nr:hypothetical protein [Verrucomicrobiales bacterium]
MSAGGRESSLDQAKAKAEDLIRGLRGNQRAAVITLASDLGFQTHLTDNPRALLDAIDRISPSTLPLRLEALKGLEKPIGGGSIHRVVFVTDGVTRDEDLPTGVEVIRVGETRGNVGIVAADMLLLPSLEQGLGLYFQLASSFEESRSFDVIVSRSGDGVIGKLIEVTADPGLNEPEIYTLVDAEAGAWELELDLKDALSADNRAWLVAQQQAPVKVRIAVEEGYFFEKAVLALEEQNRLMMVEEAPDVVLAMASTPDAPSSLIFQPDGTAQWWQGLGDDIEEVVAKVLVGDLMRCMGRDWPVVAVSVKADARFRNRLDGDARPDHSTRCPVSSPKRYWLSCSGRCSRSFTVPPSLGKHHSISRTSVILARTEL